MSPSAMGAMTASFRSTDDTVSSRPVATAVYLEIGSKRVFASAALWPGWCRSSKDEEAALDALAAYAPRFVVVAGAAGIQMPKSAAASFDVVERLPGSATTDFGAPGAIAAAESEPITKRQAERLAALVEGAWAV